MESLLAHVEIGVVVFDSSIVIPTKTPEAIISNAVR